LLSPTRIQDICVNFLLTPASLGFSVSKAALSFTAQVGTGTPLTQSIPVLASGSASDWTASIVSLTDFLTITPTSGYRRSSFATNLIIPQHDGHADVYSEVPGAVSFNRLTRRHLERGHARTNAGRDRP
jgi:hypothetical protein